MNLPYLSRRLVLVSSLAVAGLMSACSDSSSSVSTTTFDTTPTLGIVYNGTVQAYSASGTLLGSGSTGTTGKATIAMTGYTAGQPIVLKLVLTPGVTTYFNEKSPAAMSAVTTESYLTSVVPSVSSGSAVGITPATHLAAKIAGVTASSSSGVSLLSTVTADNIYKAVIQTNRLLGLPDSTNLLVAPVPATVATPAGGDTYGKILAAMAKNTTAADPIAQAAALVSSITVTSPGAVATVATAGTFTGINTILTTPANGVNTLVTYSAPITNTTTLTTITSSMITSLQDKVTASLASGTGTSSGTGSVSSTF